MMQFASVSVRILITLILISTSLPCLAIEEGPLFLPAWPFHSAGKRKSADEAQLRVIYKRVSSALDNGDVDALERVASALLIRQGETPAGRVPIHDLHQSIEFYLGEGPGADGVHRHSFDRVLSIIREWEKRYPNSAAAVVAEGDVLLSHALGARGETAARDVPTDKMRTFEDYLSLARAALARNETTGKGDPIWYETMITAGQYSGMDRKAFLELVDEGMRAYPNDFDLAEVGLIYMIPRWGGSHEQIVTYVEHVLARASPENAPLVASRIYYALVEGGYYYNGYDVVYMLHTSVEHVEQAMATLVARYPDPVNIDKQAVVTCALGDKPNLVLQLQEIGDSPLLYYWDEIGKGYYFSLCRRFAGLN